MNRRDGLLDNYQHATPHQAPENGQIKAPIKQRNRGNRYRATRRPDRVHFANVEDSTMAETIKLPVGQVLDKLRGTDVPKPTITRLDEKIETLDQETRRLRAARRHLERDQRAGRESEQ
jgi:hypothetical protein